MSNEWEAILNLIIMLPLAPPSCHPLLAPFPLLNVSFDLKIAVDSKGLEKD